FDGDGWDLWIAHWRTGPMPLEQTLSFEYNATCLANEIATVKEKTKATQVILVTHSMGGLVSRAYLHSSTYATRRDVKTLITMGSPHTGIAVTILKYLLFGQYTVDFCKYNPGFCEVDPLYMLYFNTFKDTITPNYYLIGGDKNYGPIGWLVWLTDGTNDGLVGLNSALGRMPWGSDVLGRPAGRYETDETHIDPWGRSYFKPDMLSLYSSAYKCIREIIGGAPGSNCKAPKAPQQATAGTADLNLTPLEQGHILTGETKTFSVTVDTTGQSNFGLTWPSDTLSLALVDPNGLTIDAAYAAAHPSLLTLETGAAGNGSPAWVTYSFTNTIPGNWTLKIDAPNAGANGVDFLALTALSSSRSLTVSAGSSPFKIGASAVLSATLQSGTSGITGATVTVDIARPDNITDTVSLADQGNGLYQSNYVIPNAPGNLQASFTAGGTDNGTPFSRQALALLTVMPETATLAGQYASRPVDENGDKIPEALLVDVGVTTTAPGNYDVTADLQAGGKVVAQSENLLVSATGMQTVTLRFDGADIWRSRANGPYTLTNLRIQDLQLAAPALFASNLYNTKAYPFNKFAAGTEENRPDIQYNGWRGMMNAGASSGSLRVSDVANDKVTFAFTGPSITWITKKGPDGGQARVVIDGTVKGIYDLYSATDQWQVPIKFKLANTAHTLVIKVLGTRNTDSTGSMVAVDAFLVGSSQTEDTAKSVKFNSWMGTAATTATGGGYRSSVAKNAIASFSFTGESVDWVTATGPAYGKAQVNIDGMPKETVDLYSATQKWNVVKSYPNLGDGVHTIQVQVLGVHNVKSTGNGVVLDAFSGPVSAEFTNASVPADTDDMPDQAEGNGNALPLLGLAGASGLAGLFWLRMR
ncbi:MAG TPA: hypothetical protein VF898_12810, partial [Chloroflexota bacterium]